MFGITFTAFPYTVAATIATGSPTPKVFQNFSYPCYPYSFILVSQKFSRNANFFEKNLDFFFLLNNSFLKCPLENSTALWSIDLKTATHFIK